MKMFPGLIRRGKRSQHVASFSQVDFIPAFNLFNEPERMEKMKEKGRKLLKEELAFQGKGPEYLKELMRKYK